MVKGGRYAKLQNEESRKVREAGIVRISGARKVVDSCLIV